MSWLIFAVLSYFINAANVVIDKFLLRGGIPHPLTYSFYVGILSIFAIVLFPFGVVWPGVGQFIISLAVGAVFIAGLMAYFFAIKKGEASRVLPIIGGFMPFFVFLLSYIFLAERLDRWEIAAFILLVSGGILISVQKRADARSVGLKKYTMATLGISVLSAFLLATYYTSIKYVFSHQSFISGFVWTRMGCVLFALLLLFSLKSRSLIFGATKNLEIKTGRLFLVNKVLGGAASFLLVYSLSLGSAVLINAMRGLQYVFLLIMALAFSSRAPWILEETFDALSVFQKIFATLLIGTGLIILAFY